MYINLNNLQQIYYQKKHINLYLYKRYYFHSTTSMTFRSQDMKHYTLIIPRDHAYETISQIALLQSAHFIDAGDHMNRQYQLQLKRCQQISQYVAIMKNSAKLGGYNYVSYNEAQPGYIKKIAQIWQKQAKNINVEDIKLIDYYEAQIIQSYKRYEETISRLQKLKQRRKQILQQIACSQTITTCLGLDNFKRQSSQYYQNYMGDHMDSVISSGVSYMVGVIGRETQNRFNLMIYRISRGYACVRSLDQFKFEGLQNFSQKVVVVMYPSSSSGILEKKIQKIMNMFCNSVTELDRYDFKRNPNIDLEYLKSQYNQTINYLQMNQNQLRAFFQHICDISCLDKWSTFIWKEKCIYETLNKLEMRGQLMLGNVYVPRQKLNDLSLQLSRISPSPTLQQVRLGNPPTSFATNSYTSVAQQITDTYGVPRYKEMNPSIFTTVTFPFFFGVMFGDIGHGLVLLSLGIYLIINDDWIRKGTFKAFSRLRYMVVMMGFFAFYCGWIYNDLIGFNYNFFGSCYDPAAIDPQQPIHRLHPKQGCVYPFGLDPVWGIAQNQLVYVNSLKMKIAVIIAVLHMTFGILLKAYNTRFFKKKLDFYFEFIPQIIFMVILFGYMDFLIIFKWLKPWDEKVGDIPPNQWAPSIISTMMNIGLSMGKTGDKPDGNSNMWGQRGHSWQDTLQFFILVIAFICVPWMLLPKPIIQVSNIKKKQKLRNPLEMNQQIMQSQGDLSKSLLSSQPLYNNPSHIENEQASPRKQGQNGGHEDPGEIYVHQLIETIQFVLGAVSNTASYLRLWALSLAHSQLAKVFFQKTLKYGIQNDGVIVPAIGSFITFWLLCWITCGVLMCMDTMQCFLHSLRLHWVEFQNKFYKGDGYKYQPVSIKNYLQQHKGLQNK